ACFTKAAAAAYVAALALAAVLPPEAGIPPDTDIPPKGGSYNVVSAFRRNLWIVAGLAVSFAAIGLFFVLPHWSDYRFYNWQMSVTRKPSYDLHSLVTRVTWFPILHDTFSRMWGALCFGLFGAWATLLSWRRAGAGERLLQLCVGGGLLRPVLAHV